MTCFQAAFGLGLFEVRRIGISSGPCVARRAGERGAEDEDEDDEDEEEEDDEETEALISSLC